MNMDEVILNIEKFLIKFRRIFTHFYTLKWITILFMDILITNNQNRTNIKNVVSASMAL